VCNKIDRLDASARAALPPGALLVSATSSDGIDGLRAAIAEALGAAQPA
jgi:50S ribosomal subunit-associated GTPase HflX